MVKGHLDRVTHLCDLFVEAANVLVGNVGNLGGEELLDVLPHDSLECDTSACIHDERIAGTQVTVTQRAGKLQQGLSTTFRRNEHTVGTDQLQDGHDLSAARKIVASDGDRRVVEADPLSIGQVRHVKLGRDRDAHTLAARYDLNLTRGGEGPHERCESLRRT